MTGNRGKGRPLLPETERTKQARQAQRMVNKELEAMRALGRRPLRKEAIARVAVQLKVKTRTIERRLAMLEDRVSSEADEFIANLEFTWNAPLSKGLRRALRRLRLP